MAVNYMATYRLLRKINVKEGKNKIEIVPKSLHNF